MFTERMNYLGLCPVGVHAINPVMFSLNGGTAYACCGKPRAWSSDGCVPTKHTDATMFRRNGMVDDEDVDTGDRRTRRERAVAMSEYEHRIVWTEAQLQMLRDSSKAVKDIIVHDDGGGGGVIDAASVEEENW